jgi:hypothetical protein
VTIKGVNPEQATKQRRQLEDALAAAVGFWSHNGVMQLKVSGDTAQQTVVVVRIDHQGQAQADAISAAFSSLKFNADFARAEQENPFSSLNIQAENVEVLTPILPAKFLDDVGDSATYLAGKVTLDASGQPVVAMPDGSTQLSPQYVKTMLDRTPEKPHYIFAVGGIMGAIVVWVYYTYRGGGGFGSNGGAPAPVEMRYSRVPVEQGTGRRGGGRRNTGEVLEGGDLEGIRRRSSGGGGAARGDGSRY